MSDAPQRPEAGWRRILRGAVGTAALGRLQLAWGASSVGNWAFFVAVAVYAYGEGGPAAVGLAALVRMLPAAAAAPFTGLLGDRYPRRDVLLGASVIRALAVAAVALGVAVGAPLAAVLVLAAVFTIASTAYKPAQAALLPTLAATPQQLAAANVLWTAIDNGGFLLGSLATGLLLVATGPAAVFAVTAASFALAAAVLAAIPRDARPDAPAGWRPRTVLHETRAGMSTVAGHRGLRLLVSVLAVSTLMEGAIDVLIVLMAIELLGLGESGVGWLNGAWGIGGILGGVGALALLGRGRLAAGLAVGGLLAGLPVALVPAWPAAGVAFAVLLLVGLGYALVEIAGDTLMQRLASDDVLARSFGVMETSYQLTNGLGAILAPAAVALFGLRGTLVAAGLCLPLLVVARWRALARFEAGVQVPEREFALLRAIDLFAPLPIATLETLAQRVERVALRPGETVITQGEPGDRFYAIAEGEVEVEIDGVPTRTSGPGEYFGEMALLRHIPRTATVRATTPGLLFALGREEFLAAVTGHARATQAADTVVAGRMERMPAAAGSEKAG